MKEKIKNADQLAVAAIRSISIDVINKANSGHPGTALSAAPALFELYKDFIVSNPEEPNWINRDRLVLSCGHASALLYTMLHMCGFKVTLDDLKNFRQLNSITPGHPEVGLTPGVDASSGPLGQGIAEAVGMAMAETILASKYDQKIYNHYTYCICGDGCLEEGISQEAIQYAGFQKLNKLILIYDKNNVTLDGDLAQSSVENTKARFIADDWNVIEVDDGNNLNKIKQAILKAHDCINKPSLIITKTIIGYGSAFEGTSKVHGAPLGEEDGKYAKKMYGYNYPEFTIPQEVYNLFKDTFIKRGKKAYNDYQASLNEMRKLDPHTFKKLMDFSTNNLDGYLNEQHLTMDEVAKEATRVSSQKVLNYYHNLLPNLVGGSADVAGSVKTSLKDGVTYTPNTRYGTNINWGIREFLMVAASNGMLLHGGLRTYCGCFLIFSDYAKSAIRMSALMKIPQIYLFSHDSIAVGEDGPTHQPIEQLAALRSIPNLYVFRPCDAKETYASYRLALESTKTPSAIILSRQGLPLLKNSSNYDDVKKGGYIVSKEDGKKLDLTIIATGSEVSLALDVKNVLKEKGLFVRVVSMPCQELFNLQDEKYQESILGKDYNKRVSIEMESSFGWYRYAKTCIGIDKYGASGKADEVINDYGFTKEKIAERILNSIK